MVDEFKQNEDVLSLSKFLILGVVATVVLALVFVIIFAVLSPGFDFSTYLEGFGIFEILSVIFFLIAFLAGFYGLFLLVATDDSNVMRYLSLLYALGLLAVILMVLFGILGFTFTNPLPVVI